MNINERCFALGSKRSIIREIFEYSKKRSLEIGADKVFDFSLGNPSVEPPVDVKNAILELLNLDNQTIIHGYTSAQGDLSVRKAISDNLNERFNVNLNENLIYMTCGAAASLSITLKALFNEGDECVVFAPFFTEYRVFIESANGKVVISYPKNKDFQIDLSDLESKITKNTKAIIVNSPNNPSGVVYSEDTIKSVCNLLEKKSKEYGNTIYLISDEPYRELVYDGVKVPFVMNYYKNSIVCYSFSKSLSLPGERIGYIAVSSSLDNAKEVYLAICGAGRSLGYVCAPSMFQQVAKACLKAKINVEAYKENRDILYNALTKFGFEVVKPDGAFYLFVKSPVDTQEFFEKAKELEILVVPCADFGVPNYVRIAYCVSKKRIEDSLPFFEKLAKFYNL